MRKVKKEFFCIKTRKVYRKGSEYRGKRTDLDHVLFPEEPFVKKAGKKPVKKENKQHPKTKKGAIEKK